MKRKLLTLLLILSNLLPLHSQAQIVVVPEIIFLRTVENVQGCAGSETGDVAAIWSNASQNLTVTRTFYANATCEGEPALTNTFEIVPLGLVTPVLLKITLPQGMRSCKFNVSSQGLNTSGCIPLTITPVPTRLYVNVTATGANTGLTWTDAFTDLQSALNYTCSGNLTEIWVAKGTYYPSTNPSDRDASFVMKAGVKIYGGFAGSETNLTDRNWTTNPTILSGDIDKNDGANFANNSGNSYHVIFNDNNGLTTINSLLDGFTITGGNGDYGGGMHNRGFSSPSINNVTFSGNSATQYGGGMYNFQNSSPSLNNVTFSSNKANLGGGMYNLNTCSPSLNHVTFLGNTAASQGGGMFNDTESSPSLRNCIFWGNGDEVVNFFYSSPTYTYSLVKGLNPAGTGNLDGTNAANDPLFVNAANPAGADGIFMTADDGLALQPCSPVINKGDNTNAPATDIANRTRLAGGTVDMGAYEYQGNPATGTRLYVNATAPANGDGTTWASAYQDLQVALATARVCNNITEIWVAKGTYYPTTNPSDRDASFVMKAGVKIYGGFAGSETNLTDRNWTTNPTILSGDIDHATDPLAVTGSGSTLSITGNSGNSYHVIFNNINGLTITNSLLDGFTITGGNSSDIDGDNGGGMYNRDSSPSLVNCSFSGNHASGGGGGMYNFYSSLTLTNCSFSGNQARYGGGMYNSRFSPSLTNCSFSGNQANDEGGGMFNDNSSPSLVNCSFSGNQAGSGGGMSNKSSSSPSLTNCSFSGNQANNNGGGMFNQLCSLNLTNCSFSGNQAGSGGGMSNSNILSSPLSLKNCILWGNSSEVFNDRSTPTYTKTLVKGSAVGGFQGTEDPLFVNAAGGDLRLQPCSPAINAGNDGDNSTTTDLAGNNRKFGTIDLGAYEYQGNAVAQPTASASTTTPTVCTGNTVALSASGGNQFSWVGPSGSNYGSSSRNPSFTASTTAFGGTYTVSVSNADCPLTATSTVSVQVSQGISNPQASSNSPVCVGNILNLNAIGGTTYTWAGPASFSSNQVNPSRNPVTSGMAGTYSVTVSDGTCTATASTFVQVNAAPNSTLSSNSPLCVGTTLRLSVTGAGAGATYTWGASVPFSSTLQNPTRPNATVAMSGTYSVTVNGGCGSTVLTTSVIVSPNVAPSITSLQVNNLSPNAQNNTVAVCTNAAVTLNIAATNAVTYSWRGPTGAGSGFTSSLVSPVNMPISSPRQGQYTVTVRNGCSVFNQRVINLQLTNCSNTRLASAEDSEGIEMEINAYPNPVSKTLTVEIRLKEAQPLQLKLLNSVGQTSGEWQLSEPSTVHKTELNLSDLTSGVYLLEAQAGQQRVVKKVVKVE